MDTNELKQKFQEQIENAKKELEVLKGKAEELSGDAKAELEEKSKLLEAKLEEAEDKWDEIKDLAEDTTVFVVTHNNTIGASMNPDCLLYTEQSDNEYRTYIGSLTSEKMETSDGRSVRTSDTIISTLESSSKHYNQRRELYGNIKN